VVRPTATPQGQCWISMEHKQNADWQKTKVLKRETFPVLPCPPQIPNLWSSQQLTI